jgi:hypothetical protein
MGQNFFPVRLQEFAGARARETQQPGQPPQWPSLSTSGNEQIARLPDRVGVALAGYGGPLERCGTREWVLVEGQLLVPLGPGEDREKLVSIFRDRLRGAA